MIGPLQSVFVEDPSLTFIFFISFSLILVLGLRFGVYAYWNLQATELESQATLWEFLLFVGLTAALYGFLGGIETATAVTQPSAVVTTPYRDGVFLGFLLLLALTMREIYTNDALSNATEKQTGRRGARRTVETSFALVVTTSVFGSGLFGPNDILLAVEGLAAIVISVYGLSYGSRHISRSDVRGTMIDSLLRHILPVVAFGMLVLVVDLTMLVGIDILVARHIQVVFIIMTATTLMNTTIKLRQNVAWM
jgi:hypothetical protein